jgi:hypothetical protein
MTDYNIPLRCPKCQERFMQVSAELNLDRPFTCSKCGATFKIGELQTPSGDSLADHIANIARNVFKGVKGFRQRPSRS